MKADLEIKLRHHSTDVGFCCEIWESIEDDREEPRYFGRDTVTHDWSLLADAPYGFCEPIFSIGKHVIFILCDKNGREISRDGNNRERFSIPAHGKVEAKQ